MLGVMDNVDFQLDQLMSHQGINKAHFWMRLGRSWRYDLVVSLIPHLLALFPVLLPSCHELSIFALPQSFAVMFLP